MIFFRTFSPPLHEGGARLTMLLGTRKAHAAIHNPISNTLGASNEDSESVHSLLDGLSLTADINYFVFCGGVADKEEPDRGLGQAPADLVWAP